MAENQAIKPIDPKGQLTPLSGVDSHKLIERYLSDESTETIAKDYGVTRQALGKHMLKHCEAEWKDAQVARALARKERAEDAIEAAQDVLALSKAREALKAAQWDLERTCRRIYGQDQPPQNANAVQIVINMRRGEVEHKVVGESAEPTSFLAHTQGE
jgi:predicted DNA-binding protein YlxM (UPF0122 family)